MGIKLSILSKEKMRRGWETNRHSGKTGSGPGCRFDQMSDSNFFAFTFLHSFTFLKSSPII